MLELVNKLKSCKVAVIGDVMLDRYILGKAAYINPEAPVPVINVTEEIEILGGAANVASKVVGLGGTVTLVGVVGEDDDWYLVAQLLEECDIPFDNVVKDPSRPTTANMRLMSRNQQLLRFDRVSNSPVTDSIERRLCELVIKVVSQADIVILEDYCLGVLTSTVLAAVFGAARIAKIPVVVDPMGPGPGKFWGATVVTPNLYELGEGNGCSVVSDDDVRRAAEMYCVQVGCPVAVTLGEKGITLFDLVNDSLRQKDFPTHRVEVADVTGAGDAVVATIAVALGSGISLEEALVLSNLAGAVIVRQASVGKLSKQSLESEALAESPLNKVVSKEWAELRATQVRRRGGKVVFTNGCFDVLHTGHAHLLRIARNEGDCLIVGLNTDVSVERLKGEGHPAVPQDQRAEMLAQYPYVDMVVLFNELTPLSLIEYLEPDVLVKGGDYSLETVVGNDEVKTWGGRTVLVPTLEGFSSTGIREKIKETNDG